jgi:hypothetical protein
MRTAVPSRIGVTYKTDFGLDDWINCGLYIHTVWDCWKYSTIAILHTFSSALLTHKGSQSSLVISWQRIYHSLIVTSNQT